MPHGEHGERTCVCVFFRVSVPYDGFISPRISLNVFPRKYSDAHMMTQFQELSLDAEEGVGTTYRVEGPSNVVVVGGAVSEESEEELDTGEIRGLVAEQYIITAHVAMHIIFVFVLQIWSTGVH